MKFLRISRSLFLLGPFCFFLLSCQVRQTLVGEGESGAEVGAAAKVSREQLQKQTDAHLTSLRAEIKSYTAAKLKERQGQGRIQNIAEFESGYRIVVGENSSCFSPSIFLNNVRLGVENEAQKQQLLASLRAVVDFSLDFFEAMKGQKQSLFKIIELCGVGQLAKHIPSENRTQKLLQIQGEKLTVWNDKFVGGYAQIRSDAIASAWSKGEIDFEILTGKNAKTTAKFWPVLNPIGQFRRTVRSQLYNEAKQAKDGLAQNSKGGFVGLRRVIGDFVNNQANSYQDKALRYLSALGPSAQESEALVKEWDTCLSDTKTLTEVEELGTCTGIERASRVEGEQVNIGLLVGVMNFHNIQVNAQFCFGSDTKSLVPPPVDTFKLKQTCGGLISVCTVDNVGVFAQANVLKNSAPTLCLARALRRFSAGRPPGPGRDSPPL